MQLALGLCRSYWVVRLCARIFSRHECRVGSTGRAIVTVMMNSGQWSVVSGQLQRELKLAERRRRQVVPIAPPPPPSTRFVPCRHVDIFDPQRPVRALLALAVLRHYMRPPSSVAPGFRGHHT